MNIGECEEHSPQTYSYLCKKAEINSKDVVKYKWWVPIQPSD